MLSAFIVSATLQNALLARFQTFAGNGCSYCKRKFCFFQEEGIISTTLLQVTVQITSDSECNSTYAAYWDFTDRMMCAGDPNGGKGGCWVIGSWYLYMSISYILQTRKIFLYI
jgi:hypothetical protein